MAETEIVEVLNIDASKANKSLGDLKKEIKDLKGQLIGLDETSEEYAKVLGEVAEKQHELNEITRKVKQANQDLGQVVANSAKALGGVTGAMNSLTGMMALFGGETGEAAEKMQQLMVAMMAITTGTSAIDAGVKGIQGLKAAAQSAGGAMKLLNTIMKQNPAVAVASIVIALGTAFAALAKHLDHHAEVEKRSAEASKRHAEQLDKKNKALETQIKLLAQLTDKEQHELNMLKAVGKSEKDVLERKKEMLIVRKEGMKASLEEARLQMETQKNHIEWMKKSGKYTQEQINREQTYANKLIESYNIQVRGYNSLTRQIKSTDYAIEEYITTQSHAKSATEETTKEVKDYTNTLKELEAGSSSSAEAYRNMLDAQDAYFFNMLTQEEQLKKTVEANHALAESYSNILGVLDEGTDEYFNAKAEMFKALQSEYDAQSQLDAIELERYQEQEERKTEIARQETEMRKQLRKTELDAALSITGSLVSIMDSYSSTLVEGSEQWKRISKAKTWISAIQGSISAMANAIESITPLPVALAVGGAASAALLASGKASCDQIDKTSMTGTTTTSGISTGINYKVSSSSAQGIANQVTNVRQTSTQSDIENLPDTKVYVLASDISRAQNQRKTTVKNSTF